MGKHLSEAFGRTEHEDPKVPRGFGDEWGKDMEVSLPLLMVKDFNRKGFSTSDTFMTNADVPALAMEDLILDPKNHFTGKAINSDEKTHTIS